MLLVAAEFHQSNYEKQLLHTIYYDFIPTNICERILIITFYYAKQKCYSQITPLSALQAPLLWIVSFKTILNFTNTVYRVL